MPTAAGKSAHPAQRDGSRPYYRDKGFGLGEGHPANQAVRFRFRQGDAFQDFHARRRGPLVELANLDAKGDIASHDRGFGRITFDPQLAPAVNGTLPPINQMLFSQLAEIQHLATVRIEWLTMHDTLSLSALAMANLTTEEWLLAPKVGYRASDAIMATLGAEIIAGPTGTLFGVIDEQLSAGYAELRVSY